MKYLAVDWGMKRLGFAISEGLIASPLKSVEVSTLDQALNAVRQTAKDQQSDQILVGLAEGEMGRVILKATTRLREEGWPVFLIDETLSTQKAQQVLIESGVPQSKRSKDHATAAAIILQSYLDEKP